MSNPEPVEICVNLSSVFWNQPPKAKVFIDDLMIFNASVNSPELIKWSGSLEEGEHTLAIELYDKSQYQTVLQDGVIIKDQLLNIDNISFDDIDIGFLRHTLSNYYPDKSTNNGDTPSVLQDCVNLGWNGRWELKFSTPVYIWLLENI